MKKIDTSFKTGVYESIFYLIAMDKKSILMENEINTCYLEPLENLLSITSPAHLKETILNVYFNYLIHLDKQCIPDDFTMMAEDIYLIIQFLDEVILIRGKKSILEEK